MNILRYFAHGVSFLDDILEPQGDETIHVRITDDFIFL